jgi:hypothetical protein
MGWLRQRADVGVADAEQPAIYGECGGVVGGDSGRPFRGAGNELTESARLGGALDGLVQQALLEHQTQNRSVDVELLRSPSHQQRLVVRRRSAASGHIND